jgi:uncharacterized protein YbjT (DUF2867 family)
VTDFLSAIQNDKASTVKHMVKLSAIGSGGTNPLDLRVQAEHGLSDAALEASGLSYTIVRPNFFMSNPLGMQGASIHDPEQRAFYGASGGKSISYVSPNDIAAVMAAALVYQAQGRSIRSLVRHLWLRPLQRLAAHLGHPVKYVDLTRETMKDRSSLPVVLLYGLVD